jgi:uncharacterized protein (DUF486 family)
MGRAMQEVMTLPLAFGGFSVFYLQSKTFTGK